MEYNLLDRSRKEIRVLRLKDTKGIVECNLERVQLDDYSPDFIQHYYGQSISTGHSFVDRRHAHIAGTGLAIPSWRSGHENLSWRDLKHAFDLDSDVENPLEPSCLGQPSLRHHSGPVGSVRPPVDSYLHFQPRYNWGDFEAISYCWGSGEKEKDILLNGEVVKISRNLNACLRRIRHLPEIRSGMRIWCDAICIDQDNNLERTHQVALMKDIYQGAFAVLAWLGEDSDTSSTAIDTMVQIDYLWRSTDLSPSYGFESWLSRMDWGSIISFFSREYWSRLWIVQELALNQHMSLLLCGGRLLPSSMAFITAETGFNHVGLIAKNLQDRSLNGSPGTRLSQAEIFELFMHTYTLLQKNRSGNFWEDSILDLGQQAKCKDPRDKIYGLLGLFPHNIREEIVPDYKLSMLEIYSQFARIMLRERGLTDLLAWCALSDQGDLPSWVPDYTKQKPRNHISQLMKCQAGPLSTSWPPAYIERNRLHCAGAIVDSIHALSTRTETSDAVKHRAETEHITAGNQKKDRPDLAHRYGSQASLVTSLKRTLVMNDFRSSFRMGSGTSPELRKNWNEKTKLRIDDRFWETFDSFRRANSSFDVFGHHLCSLLPSMHPENHVSKPGRWSARSTTSVTEHSRDLYKLALEEQQDMYLTVLNLKGRRLASTRTGYLALVPENTDENDLIALLHGCNFPTILRPDDSNSSSFRYVGECYVDGIMNGEALKAVNRGELQEVHITLV